MIIIYFISLACILMYTTTLLCLYGAPTSLSETYYILPKKYNFLFPLSMFIVAFSLLVFWLDISEGTSQFLIFLSCLGLITVSYSPNFKDESESGMHQIGAISAAFLSQIWALVYSPYSWISGVLLIIGYLMSLKYEGIDQYGSRKSSLVFFMEMSAFFSTYVIILIYYITH